MTVDSHPAQLQRLMRDKGLKQADLARELDQNKQTIHKLYHGETDMSRDWAVALAPLLGVRWQSLVDWETDQPAGVGSDSTDDAQPPLPPISHDDERVLQDAEELGLMRLWRELETPEQTFLALMIRGALELRRKSA